MKNLNPASPVSVKTYKKQGVKQSITPKDNEIVTNYFIISYKKKKKDSENDEREFELKFKQSLDKPECLHTDKISFGENIIEFRKVFKYTYKNEKKIHSFKFEFEINEEYYEIFYNKIPEVFIFDVELKTEKSKL